MACNGNGHHPWCNCGWGGDTSFGRTYADASAVARSAAIPPCARPELADGHIWRSFRVASPNARCPVCDDPVFFIVCPNGGRVFFDELGPPWPKHPCTDSGTLAPRASLGAPNLSFTTSTGWYLLGAVEIKHGNDATVISGYSPDLESYLSLCGDVPSSRTIVEPVLIKPHAQSGFIEVSYPYTTPGGATIESATHLFCRASQTQTATCLSALRDDHAAQNLVGWQHSFKIEDVSQRDYDVAHYWFSLAAGGGNAAALNNLGVMYLNGYGLSRDEPLALGYLIRAAMQMTPTAFAHIGKIFRSRPGEENRLLAALFFALEANFRFDKGVVDNCSDEDLPPAVQGASGSAESASVVPCFSPQPIERYRYIHTVAKLAGLKDYLARWNLFWLSCTGLDESLAAPADWFELVHIPRTLVDTLMFDMDVAIHDDVTLDQALRMHPRRFLHYFTSADLSLIDVAREDGWKERVIERATSAAARIPDATPEFKAPVIAIGRRLAKDD